MSSQNSPRKLVQWDHQYVWHPFTQMKEWEQEDPLIIERGEGSYLIDTKGERYLDGVSSLWVNIHGHRHPTLNQAIKSQLDRISHSTLLGLSNPPAILLARELVKLAPAGLTRVFYSDNGSTAVEVALKMAVQYWQQRKPHQEGKHAFVHLGLAYHGDTIGDMSISGIDLFHKRFHPLLFTATSIDPPYCYRCPLQLTYPSCQIACLEPLETLLSERYQDIAAVVIEPLIQAVAGMITAPKGYLTHVRELCTRYQVLLIVDEVATGFGRTGRMFACEHENVTPDIMAVAKGLTGGYLPLAATLTTEDIYQAFLGQYDEWKTFFHGHSYTGNPLGCSAALANLKIFRRERTLLKLQKRIPLFHSLLQTLAEETHVGDIRKCGYMVGIELVQSKRIRKPFSITERKGHLVAQAARERGLLIRPIGNIVVVMPPLNIKVKELKEIVSILRQSLRAVDWQ